MSNVRHITVKEDDDGQRLDRWLKKCVPDIPYVLVQKMIRQGQIRVDGKRAKTDTRLAAGQDVRIPPHESKKEGPQKAKITERDIAFLKSLILFDDGFVMALNKPAGLAVQGGSSQLRHIDGLLEALTNKKGVKPRLVHRLDKETSGVLLVARTAQMARDLGDMFHSGRIRKIYWAITTGVPEMEEGRIAVPLNRGEGRSIEIMVPDPENGKKAVTDYSVLDHAGKKAAFVAFWPRTGRTHQIRVHAQYAGFPLVGDDKYGVYAEEDPLAEMNLSKRLHLHARRVIFTHPKTGRVIDITAPLPDDLRATWKAFDFEANLKTDPFADMVFRKEDHE